MDDLHQNRGYDSLRIQRKGGRRDALAIHPQTAQRIKACLEAAGHGSDSEGPMFRPMSKNRKRQETRRHMHPDAIDRVLRKHAWAIGLERGYSAHSTRATFITTTLENGASLEEVQKAAAIATPARRSSTTAAATTPRNRRPSGRIIERGARQAVSR